MACDAARSGAVSVLPRRVAAGRTVQRLLVLGGLLIAGWLLGCAAQSAHADEMPAAPSQVVAKTPVLGQAVEAAAERRPVGRVVKAVADKAPQEKVTQDVSPLPEAPEAARKVDVSAPSAGRTPELQRRTLERAVPRVSAVARTAPAADGQVSRHVVRHHPAPLQAPERPDGHSAAGGLVMPAVTAGFSNVLRAPVPPRASLPRVFGAVPPAVRTASDEPSFAPD